MRGNQAFKKIIRLLQQYLTKLMKRKQWMKSVFRKIIWLILTLFYITECKENLQH